MEGIKLQDENIDPGGPFFRRKKNKSQKGVPFRWVTPHKFFGIICIPNKIQENNIKFADLIFLPTLGLGSVSSVAVGPPSEEGIRQSRRGWGFKSERGR